MSLRRRWPLAVLALLVLGYAVYFSWLTLRAYDAFVYQAYDLGIYDQAVWNTLQGRPFRSTLEEPYTNLLGDHFEPILLPIALTYLLWDSPKTLLLLQTVALALGALPVFWLARDALGRALDGGAAAQAGDSAGRPRSDPRGGPLASGLALGFVLVYLLYPPVHSANVFEFHPSALAIPLLLFAFYFLRRRRLGLYLLFVVLAMSTKEVLPLTTAALGLYVWLIARERWAGLATLALSALWFGLVVLVVIPYFSPEGQSQYFAEYYGWLGGSAGEVLGRLVAEPQLVVQRLLRADSLLYVRNLLRPLAYMPLLAPLVLLLAAPALLLNVMSDFAFQHQSLNFFQYAAAIAPFALVAAVDGTAWLVRHLGAWLERRVSVSPGTRALARPLVAVAAVAAMLLLTFAAQRYHGFLPFSRDFYLAPRGPETEAAQALVQQVPDEVPVAADLIFGPHLSQRPTVYLYPSPHETDYVLADALYRDRPFPPRDRYEALQALLDSGQYGVVDGRNGYLLLQRGGAQTKIPERFYDFARASLPMPQVATDIVFGDELRLLGYDLVWERPVRPGVHLVLYWQALRPVERDLRLFFVQTDPRGELLPGTEQEFDTSVWLPPSAWTPGEVIRTSTLHWSVEDPGAFGLAVGVVDGPGFWDLDKRLRPDLQATPWPMPQVHDGSLVWLATVEADGRLATMVPPAADR